MDMSFHLSAGDGEDAAVKEAFKESFRHLWAMYSSNEKALKSKLEKLGRKIDYHEKLKESLDEDVRWRMEKMDQLLTTNKRLYDEVKELRNRPPPACLNCIGLKRQVENLTSIGDNIMSLLGHNKRFTDTLQTMYTQALDSEVHMDASNDALTQALTEALNVEPIAQIQKQSAQMVPARKSPIKVKDDGTVIIKKTTVSRVLTTTVVSPHRADSLSPGKRRSPSPGKSGKRSSLSPGRRSSLSPRRPSSLSPIRRSNLTPGKQNSPLPGNRNSQSPGKRTSLCETKTIIQSPRAITNMSSTKHCTVSPSLEISPSKNREGASATEPILTPSPSKRLDSLLTKKPPKQQLNASQSKVVESPNKLKEANDTVVAHSSVVDRFPHSSSVVKEISPQSRRDISRASSPTEQMGSSQALPRINKKNLKLHSNKRHRFTEEIPPNHKRARISSHKEKVPKPHNETTMDLTLNVIRNPMRVLVEDTCISQRARQKSSVHDKTNDTTDDNWKEEMDLVIPETVPLNFTLDEDYKDDMDGIHDGQSRAQAVIQSPPSKSSNSTNNLTNKHRKKVVVNVVANVGSTGGRPREDDLCAKSPPHDTSSSDSQDDVSSTPVSPVFKRNIAWKNGDGSSYSDNEVRSPSLFDEEVHERPLSSTLSQGNATVVTRKGSESSGCHSNMNVKSKLLEKRNQDTSNTCLSLSMQSNPSPSVLSGKVVNKQSADGNSGWLSTGNCASPQVQRQPQLVMLPEAVLSLRNEGMTSGQPCSAVVQCVGDICSPIRLTRARHKMLSQEVGDSAVNVSPNAKALRQTTLSQKFFQPQNYLSEIKSFKGKRLTDKEQELLDLDEAMRRSLSDIQVTQSEDDPTLNKSKNEAQSIQSENSQAMTEVDMTEPQLTSTPCTISGRLRKRRKSSDDSVDNAIFKKPSLPTTPKPTTPKKNSHSKNLSQEMHRSPCLNDTVDPNEASPSKRLFNEGKSRNRDPVATQTNRMSNLDGNSSEVGLLPSGNGSLDPDVRLSQMDEDMSSVHTAGQASSQVGNERFLQSVSFHELYAADGESQMQGIRAEGTMVEKKRQSSRPSASQSNIREHSEEIVGFSKSTLVFGPSKEHLKAKDRRKEPGCSKAHYQIAENLDDSFDILPKKKSPGFAHVEVVRKKAERKKLKTYACPECMAYYHNCDLSEEQIKERMKNCRHKARYVPPGTPEHYWDVGFPDTQECEERGYLNRTQAKPSNFRRNRGFRALFKSSKRVPVVSDFTDLFEGEDT